MVNNSQSPVIRATALTSLAPWWQAQLAMTKDLASRKRPTERLDFWWKAQLAIAKDRASRRRSEESNPLTGDGQKNQIPLTGDGQYEKN